MAKKVETIEGFDVYFEAEKEFVSERQHFVGECGWTIEQYRAHRQSKPAWFSAKVTIKKGGVELSNQYLGCCSYQSGKAFYTTYHDDYFADMVKEGVEEAKQQLPSEMAAIQSRVVSLNAQLEMLAA